MAIVYKMEIEMYEVPLLMAGLSASILNLCEENPSPKEGLVKAAGRSMHDYVDWSEHGYVNALQMQVGLVYQCMKDAVENDTISMLLAMQLVADIMIRALTTFQDWKTLLCSQVEEEQGKGFGSETLFYTIDYTDQIPAFKAKLGIE